MTSLTFLSLSRNWITRVGATVLAQKTSLMSLFIDENLIGDDGTKAFARSTSLKSLSLGCDRPDLLFDFTRLVDNVIVGHPSSDGQASQYTQISSEGLKALAQNESLTSLYLIDVQMEVKIAESLANNTSLTFLDLVFDPIEDDVIEALAQSTSLTTLKIEHTPLLPSLGDRGAKALEEMVSTGNCRRRMSPPSLYECAMSACARLGQTLGSNVPIDVQDDFEKMTKPCFVCGILCVPVVQLRRVSVAEINGFLVCRRCLYLEIT